MAIPPAEIVELTDGVFAWLHPALTNAGIIVGDDSVLVIDSLRVPSFGRALIEDVKKITPKPIRYVIDTHSHWDHAWGNEVFTGATIIGHANARRAMEEYGQHSEYYKQSVIARGSEWTEEIKTITITPPDLTYTDTLELFFGGRRVDLRYLGRAHTDGDTFIHLPDDGLIFTGDVIQNAGTPYMLDGYMEDWITTDTRFMELPFERFMSGHGPLGDRAAGTEARDYVIALVNGTRERMLEGKDEDTIKAEVTESLRPRFGGFRGFDNVGNGVGRTYREFVRPM